MNPVILVVDDNEEILDFIEQELNDKYTVIKALHILKTEAIHAVVSDVMMPEIDGFELCRRIKQNFEYSHVPVILLTAKNTLQSKIEGLELGADAYIEKPFSPEYLRVQIANLLTNRAMIREYFASTPMVHMKSMAYSRADELFLERLGEVIQQNLEDAELDVEKLAQFMNMSRPTLYRKINSISDLTPNEFINITRLKKAAELLLEGKFKIYEVALIVGYGSQTNFGRNFSKQFGMTPSEYIAQKLGNQHPET